MQTTVKVGQKARNSNLISKRHFEQVTKRSPNMRMALVAVWGLTWELLGRRFIPLGQASALAQYSDENGPPQQTCVVAEHGDDLGAKVIAYDRVRMCHDWGRTPFPGATSRRLDPREKHDPSVLPGDRPNASWVRAGLLVDLARAEATHANYDLPSVPVLPGFCYAYHQRPEFTGMTDYLSGYVATQDGNALSDDEWHRVAAAEFDKNVIPPSESGLNVFLAPTEIVAEPGRYVGIYEDFTAMLGRTVPNPVLDLSGITVENPVWRAARSRHIHLRTLLRDLTVGQAPGTEDESLMDACDALKSGMRDVLGVTADTFTDADLTEALLHPDAPLTSTKGIVDLPVEARAEQIRELLLERNPYVLADATDEDLLKAATQLYSPLTLSKGCAIQTLYRDPRTEPMHALAFSSVALNRPGVCAGFAAPADWKPTKRAR